jgi:RsiW-degrading membrane proteinase PrsW (M82 family)
VTKKDPHSIRNEPFYGDAFQQPKDSVYEEPGFHVAPAVTRNEERALHTVWDKPTLRAGGAMLPPEAFTYSRWYEEQLARTPAWKSRATLLALAICGGPFAILATLATTMTDGMAGGLIYLIVIGPAIEEMMKIGAALLVLENRPWLFRNGMQTVIAAASAGILFAVVENLLYIHVYNPEGTEAFRLWRWTVCTALHTGTSTIAGLGLLRMWNKATAPARSEAGIEFQRPQVLDAYPYILTAVVIHGVYNGFAVVMSWATDWI